MKNRYEIRGDTTVIFIERKNGEVLECLIDTEDLEKVSRLGKLSASSPSSNEKPYVYGYIREGNRKYKRPFLHRFLMDCPKGMLVDHINGNVLDNRKSNLRITNYSINNRNRHRPNKNNTNGVIGVRVVNGRYYPRVWDGKSEKSLGGFDTIEEAIKAREKWVDDFYNKEGSL